MKITSINSGSAPTAIGGYSQAVLVDEPRRLLFVSGQIPESSEGRTPDDFESQCRQVWRNVIAQLHEARMSAANLIKVTIFLSSRQHSESNSRIREEFLEGHKPALTVIIAGIYDEQWLLEIEAIAVD
jgi:enamine deaminase RidA (YjgF/YER057c/UK114 family)